MKKILITLFLIPLFSFGQIISQYVETNTGSHPKLIEIYNNTGETLNFDESSGGSWLYVKYRANGGNESNKEIIKTGSLAPGEVMVLGPSEATYAGAKTQILTNNPSVRYIEETWYFNGNDQIRLERGGVTTDYFGRDANSWPTYSGVESKNSNISRKAGVLTGRSSWWPMPDDTDASNAISSDWVETVDFPSGYPTSSDLAVALTGVGVPPDNYIFDGTNWLSWDSSNNSTSTTAPSGSSTRPLYVATGTATLSTTGLSFPSIEVANGSTLNISAGADVTTSSSSNTSSYRSGDFVNNGTVTMHSDATNFSSLIIEGNATGNITYNRWVNSVSNSSPSDANPGWDLVGSPVLNGTLDPTTLATSGDNYAILPFDNSSSSTGSWTNTTNNGTFTTSTGVGYAMAKSTAGTVSFTGVPNTKTNTNVAITNNTSGSGTHWNLVANPFPAFLALNGNAKDNSSATSAFLWYNTNSNATPSTDVLGHTGFDEGIWYWDGTDYITKNNSSSGNLYAVPGQAFFISAENVSANLSFRTGNITTQASLGAGDDFIEGDVLEDEKAEIHISAIQNQIGNSTEIYFNEFGSDGLNNGYDTRSFPSGVNRIYSRLIENDSGVNLAIQTLSFDEMWDKVIPVGINAAGGDELTISISHRTTPADLNIYLEDTEEGTMTNLLDGDYVLTPTSDLEGVGRFFIRMTADTMSNEEVSTSMLNAYKEIDASYITIEGLATQSNETKVSLYNILGREVLSTTLNNNMGTQTISTVGLSAGIYVIELESGSDRLTKKLLIQ